MPKNNEEKEKPAKKRRSGGGGGMSLVELVAPAATALLSPFILTKVQKPDADKAKNADNKVWVVAAAGSYFASKSRSLKRYAPALLVLGAMSFRRGQALAGKLETDPEKAYVVTETAVAE